MLGVLPFRSPVSIDWGEMHSEHSGRTRAPRTTTQILLESVVRIPESAGPRPSGSISWSSWSVPGKLSSANVAPSRLQAKWLIGLGLFSRNQSGNPQDRDKFTMGRHY